MTIDELNKRLDKITHDFSSQISAEYSESSEVPAKEQDIGILAHRVYGTLNEFKDEIIKYLKQTE